MFLRLLKRALAAFLLLGYFKFLRAALRRARNLRELKSFVVPSAVKHPVLGFIPSFTANADRMYHFRVQLFDQASKEAGRRVEEVLLPSPLWHDRQHLFTRDPKMVKMFLKDEFDSFVKPDNMNMKPLIGNGIFVANHGINRPKEHPNWMFQRKTASKIFTRKIFNGHVAKTVQQNLIKVDNLINDALRKKEDFAMKKAIFAFTLDTIGEIGCGIDLRTLEEEESPPFAFCFDEVGRTIGLKLFSIGSNVPGFRLIYEHERSLDRSLKILNELCYKIIRQRKSEGNLEGKGDILSLFLQADGSLSDEYLRDIVMSFILAGRDTTACTIACAFFLLATHPLFQEELFQEIRDVLKDDSPTVENLKDLPFLDGVVFESLRLFPAIPADPKQAAVDVILEDGRKIPKGTMMFFEPFVMGRDEKYYDEPNRFLPRRWITQGRQTQEYDPFAFPNFQAGPRICIGKDLALLEAKMFLVEVVRKYSFTLPPEKMPKDFDAFIKDPSCIDGKPVYRFGVTLVLDMELRLQMTRR